MAARSAKRGAPRPIAFWSGVVFLVAWIAAAALAPMLAPYDPTAVGTLGVDTYRAPSSAHWLGTDEFGRDVWSRVVWGARVALAIGAGVALLASTLGAAVGLWAGWKGGRTDAILMRVVDIMLSVPRTFLIVLVVGVLRPSLAVLLFVLACTGWMATARLVRAAVRAQARGPAVEAAR